MTDDAAHHPGKLGDMKTDQSDFWEVHHGVARKLFPFGLLIQFLSQLKKKVWSDLDG